MSDTRLERIAVAIIAGLTLVLFSWIVSRNIRIGYQSVQYTECIKAAGDNVVACNHEVYR